MGGGREGYLYQRVCHVCNSTPQVSALVEEAVKRLDPDETADGYAEEQTVTFAGVLAVLGPQIRSRITHAFGDKSLEELAVHHRTDMAGLQVREKSGKKCFCLARGGGFSRFLVGC